MQTLKGKKWLTLVALTVPMLLTACGGGGGGGDSSSGGNCDVPTDIAADGSVCGDRAASERPGGR